MAADAGLKEEVEALRVAILAAGRAQADAADPFLRKLALAASDRARIAESAVAGWRASVAAHFAALEAGRRVDGQAPDASPPPAPTSGPING